MTRYGRPMTISAAPPKQASNGELVRWAFERINDHDVTPLKEFWTADTVEHFPDRTCRGSEEIAAYFEDTFKGVPDMNMEIVALAEQGDDVFVQWRLTGRHTGVFQGIAPTGRELSIDGIDHFVISDDQKVISNFVVFDRVQFGQQLGLMPPDDSRGDRAMKAAFNARTKIASKLRR